MPWCPGCDRFLSPATVTPAGDCPRCGAPVDPGRARAPSPTPDPDLAAGEPTGAVDAAAEPADPGTVAAGVPASETDDDRLPLPWHFKMLVGAITLYLGYRALQGIEWLVHRF